MAPRIERTHDARLLFDIEQIAGMKRTLPEVARRLAVSEAFVARDDAGTPLGVGTLAIQGEALAWIGGMAVLPTARRQGAARTLLRAMLERARERGVHVVGLDASAMGRPLYESEGFVALGRTSRWARVTPRGEGSVSARHAVHPISISEAMEIATFDAERFGAQRLPFLMALLHDFPWQAFMSRDRASGEVTGFILASERALGPLVAEDADAATVLLSACESAGAEPRLLIMDDHAEATRMLQEASYAPEGVSCMRMTLGGAALPGRRTAVYGAATWALG